MAKEQINTGMAHNMIANGTIIKGIITTDSDMRIDGEVEGDIICTGKIVIGTLGKLTGNLKCASAEIMGKVDGTIKTTDQLSMKATAQITGEITTKVLSIEPNAIFTGSCTMTSEEQ